jgi:hypothetical protein
MDSARKVQSETDPDRSFNCAVRFIPCTTHSQYRNHQEYKT